MKKMMALGLAVVMAMATLTGCGSSDSGKKTAKVVEIDLTSEEYAFGVDKTQPELLDAVNDFIKEIKENGKLDEICNNYFGDGTPVAVTSGTYDANKDQLVVATNAAFEPFEYMEGENYLGIDMEIAAALAEKLGKELVIQNMDFDSVCLSVGQQKCDIAMTGLTIKEDRLITLSGDTEFDSCKDGAEVEAILNKKDASTKIGCQTGTTGQFFIEGDESWGFAGLPATAVGYKNGSLAVQDLLNGNIQYVIIDSAPATCITEAINKMQ